MLRLITEKRFLDSSITKLLPTLGRAHVLDLTTSSIKRLISNSPGLHIPHNTYHADHIPYHYPIVHVIILMACRCVQSYGLYTV